MDTHLFQSTLPLREVTILLRGLRHVLFISIHTSLAGSDLTVDGAFTHADEFQSTLPLREVTWSDSNPHYWSEIISIHTSLAGSDLRCVIIAHVGFRFQSTLPLREVTRPASQSVQPSEFQSTLPLREVTNVPHCKQYWTCNFNPHFPCGK